MKQRQEIMEKNLKPKDKYLFLRISRNRLPFPINQTNSSVRRMETKKRSVQWKKNFFQSCQRRRRKKETKNSQEESKLDHRGGWKIDRRGEEISTRGGVGYQNSGRGGGGGCSNGGNNGKAKRKRRGEGGGGERKKERKKKKHTSCWRSVSRMASTPYISIDIYVYTCIEARLSTGSYFPVRQRVVVLVWSSRPVQLLMYSPTRITSSSLAHFSHFKCPLSFIFSLSFPSLDPLPALLPRALARSLSYAHHIYHTFYALWYHSLVLFDRFSPLLRPYTHATSPTRSLSLSIYVFIYIYIYIYVYPLLCYADLPDWLDCAFTSASKLPRLRSL